MNIDFVFKILEHKEWFNNEEEYKGSLIDLKDPFKMLKDLFTLKEKYKSNLSI